MTWLLVGAGGAIGSMARHGLNRAIEQRLIASSFPFGIFAINVLGSAAIGLIAGLLASQRLHLSNDARVFLTVGVLGGFTTFSAFTLDNLTLVQGGHYGQAAANAAGQVIVSFAAAWAGFALAK